MDCKYTRKLERMRINRYSRFFTEHFSGYADRVLDAESKRRDADAQKKIKEAQLGEKSAFFAGFMTTTFIYMTIGFMWFLAWATGVIA